MKLYLLCSAMLLSSSLLIAREHPANNGRKHTMCTQQVAEKTTAAKERVIGHSYHTLPSGPVTDTCRYFYSGSRGSLPLDWFGSVYPNPFLPVQNVKCDSFTYKISTINERGSYQYNSSDKAIENKTYAAPLYGIKDHHYYYYDASARFNTDSQYYYPYSSSYRRYRTYDGSGYLVLDSQYNFTANMPSDKYVYTNDASGNRTLSIKYLWNAGTLAWEPSLQMIYTYDAFNHEILSVKQDYVASAWVNSEKDSTYYPGSSDRFTYTATFTWSGGAWTGTEAFGAHVNASNQWDTIYFYDWNNTSSSFELQEKDYQTYTSFGNLQYTGGILYNITTGTYASAPYDLNTYYYEIYDNVGVGNPPPAISSVKISPNPTSGMLHLAMNDVAASSLVRVSIINISGQTMMSNEITGNTDAAYDVSAYPSGVYIVTATGEGLQFRETFLKK